MATDLGPCAPDSVKEASSMEPSQAAGAGTARGTGMIPGWGGILLSDQCRSYDKRAFELYHYYVLLLMKISFLL